MTAQCQNCIFMHAYMDWRDDAVIECRRYPPVVDTHPNARHDGSGTHPRVGRKHWCGEFKDVTPPARVPQGRSIEL